MNVFFRFFPFFPLFFCPQHKGRPEAREKRELNEFVVAVWCRGRNLHVTAHCTCTAYTWERGDKQYGGILVGWGWGKIGWWPGTPLTCPFWRRARTPTCSKFIPKTIFFLFFSGGGGGIFSRFGAGFFFFFTLFFYACLFLVFFLRWWYKKISKTRCLSRWFYVENVPGFRVWLVGWVGVKVIWPPLVGWDRRKSRAC